MSSLQNLQTLDLSLNPLNLCSIPPWLTTVLLLSRIYLAGCGIKGQIPDSLQTTESNTRTGLIREPSQWIHTIMDRIPQPALLAKHLKQLSFG